MKVLCFGSCNIDYVYSLNSIVVNGETTSAQKMETFPGGKGLNQSIACAKAGAKVYHAGLVGFDGKILIDALTESNVKLDYLGRTESNSGHAIIQLDKDGNNAIVIYAGANFLVTEEYVDSVLENFGVGDFILLQNEINGIDYIIDRAYEKGIKIVFNPAPYNALAQKVDLSKISYLILNEVEAQGFAGKGSPEQNLEYICKKYPALKVVLTIGGDGALFSEGKGVLYQPAFKVDVVDTTAAGDTFIGYFIAETVAGKDAQSAMKTASVAAALSVSKKGASCSIPDMATVKDAVSQLKSVQGKNSKTAILKRKIDEYLDGNIKDATVKGLSSKLGYSESYTSKLVISLTGVSFIELLKTKRIDLAANLLVQTDVPVGEIILDVGYENHSFFRKTFTKRYGITPNKYRKLKTEKK